MISEEEIRFYFLIPRPQRRGLRRGVDSSAAKKRDEFSVNSVCACVCPSQIGVCVSWPYEIESK